MILRRTTTLILALFAASLPLVAQQSQPPLTVDFIMEGHGLTGHSPRNVRWAADSSKVYFQWKLASDPLDTPFDTWVVDRSGRGLRRLSKEEARHTPRQGVRTRDNRRTLFVEDGDVWMFDTATSRSTRITHTEERESSARFTHDEKGITFVRGNNLFLLSLQDGTIRQMTTILRADEKMPADWKEEDLTASQKYVRDEERKLLDIIERRTAREQREKAERKEKAPRKPMQLKKGESVSSLELSADGRFAIVATSVEDPAAKDTIVPNYVTTSGYTQDIPARNKVGDGQPRTRLASVDTATGEVKWLDHGLKRITTETQSTTESTSSERATQTTPPPANAQQDTATTAEAGKQQSSADRDVELGQLVWSRDGQRAVMAVRSADNKDRWILAFDPATAKTRVLASMHDDAWINWLGEDELGFTGDDATVYFISEQTGFAHLYTVPYAGGTPVALTSGRWEVTDVELSDDRKTFYLTTSEESPYVRHLYRMPVTGGARVRLTEATGSHDAIVSPDGTMIADVYSYTNTPPDLYLQPLGRKGAAAIRATTSPTPAFTSREWMDVPIVTFRGRDGTDIPARLYKPANAATGGPAVIFVHGAGYLQNVHRWWSSYFREYMFHHLLVERGYTVLDIDYRGSAGYGRDWRTGIYRHMGGKDLDDHIDGARWLVSNHGIDPKRIGIYGGSYGGFITFMAMFTQPDVFAAGAALRPVTDWAHYNHPYTSNILNVPQEDREAYVRSSPIYFAEGLKGALLICHGMVDVNVHFQDSVRLVQRLIELRKENWELAVYPVEDHSFVEPTSWADEYKRVLKLFETNLRPQR